MRKKLQWLALIKREYFSYLNSPLAYVVIVPFLLVSTFLFFRTAIVLGDANLRPFIELLPWYLVVIGPALAMRSFAEETRKQTSELLFAHPLTEWMIVGAKFLGLWLFYATMLLTTLALPLSILAFSSADIGVMVSQYFGALMLGGAFLAIGVAASAWIGSSIGAFLVGAAVNFGLVLLNLPFVILMFPGILGQIVAELAVATHMTNFSRGVVDVRDTLYFATMILLALALAVVKLSERKVAERPAEKRALLLAMVLIAGVGILGNVFMYRYPLRVDLTRDGRFSLSSGSKQLIRELPDRVTITLYASRNLPGPMQVTLRETGDTLRDFSRLSDKLVVNTTIVEPGSPNQTQATQAGIREVQFNQIGSGSFQVQTGFLGMNIRYGNQTEVIDFVEDASDLEYRLARLILKLTREDEPALGLLSMGEAPTSQLSTLLGDQYSVVTLDNETPEGEYADLAGVIVVDGGGSSEYATAAAYMQNYLQNGGKAAFFIDGVSVDTQYGVAGIANNSLFNEQLDDFGLRVSNNLVYDLQLNEAVTLPSGNMRVIVSYPFWIRPLVNTEAASFASGLTNVVLGWASQVTVSDKEGVRVTPLLSTGKAANSQDSNFTLDPQSLQGLAEPKGEAIVVGAVAEKGDNQRVVVVGDATIVSDDFLQNSAENQALVTNVVDWVAADPVLLTIPKRTGGRSVFVFDNPTQIQIVQWGTLLAPPLLVAGFGMWWLKRRRMLTQRVYQGGSYGK